MTAPGTAFATVDLAVVALGFLERVPAVAVNAQRGAAVVPRQTDAPFGMNLVVAVKLRSVIYPIVFQRHPVAPFAPETPGVGASWVAFLVAVPVSRA